MAPNKVEYWFASWVHDEGRRGLTMLYKDKEFLIRGIEMGIIGVLANHQIHSIEIEE
ncbi:MAG: hypothetical protein QN716_01610 [Nitrososphaeraceae archaeon]|nr:hypothetical protein [Nitrososphaeraceae archaeon]